MKLDLTCETDVGWFAIYDPGGLPPDFAPARFEQTARAGDSIAYSYGGDGDMRFRLFVDEPIDPELERRADGKVTGILRVPSGRLVARGVEQVGPTDEAAATIAAGVYEVTAFDVEWDEEDEEAAEAAARRASPAGRRIERILGPLTGMLVVVTIFGGAVGGGVTLAAEPLVREVLWGWAARIAPWYVGLWVVLIALWKLSPALRATEARDRAQRDYPGAVVHLRRLTDG